MVDNATAKYLNDNIGGVLSKALAEMAVAQPTDGVNFLSRWLSTYAELEEAKKWRDQEAASVAEDRSRAQAMLAEKADDAKRKAAEMNRKISEFQGLLDLLGSAETVFSDKFWLQLLSTVQTFTGAQAVYLGLLDEEGIEGVEGKCIVYTHATAGSEWMLDKILDAKAGVTWGALEENPTEDVLHLWRPPKKEPVAAEAADGGDEPPPEEPTEPFLPVNIEYVTDVAEVHYFDMTRLGAYMAVPLVYTSYYTADALADAIKYEEEKKIAKAAAEQAAAEGAAQRGEADDVAATAGDEQQASADSVAQAEPMKLRGSTIKMVLCVDTLGKNTVFEESKIPQLLELCKAFGSCKERTETQQVAAQALSVLDEREKQGQKDEPSKASRISELRAELEDSLKQQMDGEKEAAKVATDEDGKEVPSVPLDKDLMQEKYKYFKARMVFLKCKDLFLELTTWVVASQEMLNIMAATFYMYGLAKEEIYPKRKSMLKWDTLKAIIVDPKFLAVVETKDVCEQRKDVKPEHKLVSIRELASPPEFTEEKAREVSPAFEVLYTLIQAAMSYRQKDLATRKADWVKQKDKAEEAGEEFKETALEDIDDDFAELA